MGPTDLASVHGPEPLVQGHDLVCAEWDPLAHDGVHVGQDDGLMPHTAVTHDDDDEEDSCRVLTD